MAESNPVPPPNPEHIPPPQLPDDLPKQEEGLSAFQKFLGPTATKEQVQRFMNTWVNSMIHDIKKAQQKWKERMDKMKRGEY